MTSFIHEYARFVTGLHYEDLPDYAVTAAKKCLVDGMANMIYGTCAEMGEKALRHVRYMRETDTDMVIAPGGRELSLSQASFAASVMARCADLDDGHRFAMGHPGSVLVPAVMIYGQKQHTDGRELLTALVAGYEVYTRLGASINPTSYRERGFDSTGITGAVACTAALGRLFHLTEMELANALGIVAQFAGALIEYQNDGTMAKVLVGSWAIDNAMKAIRLARDGFTGASQALEGKKGFIQAFSNDPLPNKGIEGLGESFRIQEVYFKVHACMRGLHAAVDALLDIRQRAGITPEDIAEIEVHTTPFVGRLSKPHPDTEIGAQSSVEFALATASWYGHIASEETLREAMNREEVYDLASRVVLMMDPEVESYVKRHPDHWGAVKILVRKKDGTEESQFTALPRGEAENPLSWEELCSKLVRMSEGTEYEGFARDICDRIRAIEKESNPFVMLAPWKYGRAAGVELCM